MKPTLVTLYFALIILGLWYLPYLMGTILIGTALIAYLIVKGTQRLIKSYDPKPSPHNLTPREKI